MVSDSAEIILLRKSFHPETFGCPDSVNLIISVYLPENL